jgi:formylglycine-generating enzyme required for sulfatase activity
MWQRKQTIYLLVVTLLMGSLAWLMPKNGLEGNILSSVAGVTALFSFITIFFFKNRQLQKSLCKLGMLLIVAWIAYFCYNQYYVNWRGQFTIWPPSLVPLVALIVYSLAIKGIKFDENLLKSMDRIRTIAIMMATSAAMLVSCGSSEEPNEGDTKTVKVGDAKIELVYVAPGNFRMGATAEQDGFDSFTELPAHDVQLTKGYWIGKTEVTQELWDEVMDNNPSDIKQYAGKDDTTLPVMNITWNDAQEFVKKLSKKTGEKFRLPTEAEWEYAARGAGKTFHLQYSGSKYLDRVACYRATSNGTPHPVGQYMPNELDMRDMNGNVSEWVEDNYETYRDTVEIDPCVKIGDAMEHVARGGSFISTTTECRTASREKYAPEFKAVTVGLRVVMDK